MGPPHFKVGSLRRANESGNAAYWWCVRCRKLHVARLDSEQEASVWNQDLEKPTLGPSFVFRTITGEYNDQWNICHSMLVDGNLCYLSGTTQTHEGAWAGRVVPMAPIPPYKVATVPAAL